MPLEIGTKLGSYCVTGLLGTGGMGEIYRAQDTRLGRDVALKVLPPRIFDREDWLARFEREARIVSSLNHPHILTVHEIGEVHLPGHFDPTHFIVTELVDGTTMREAMSAGPVDLRRLLEYLAQVADALRKAHSAGIVHRDLKPENIMFARDGYAKILDFGLAKSYSGDPSKPPARVQTQQGIAMGTVGYMSPEQIQGKAVDHRSDVFSFGCVLYEMLTGTQPFAGEDLAVTLHRITGGRLPALPAKVDRALKQIVKRCLEKNPDRRFQNMSEIAEGLRAVAARLETGVPYVPSAPRTSARLRSTGRTRVVAVLPFTNDSGDPEMEYLSDGITESIIYTLSQMRTRMRVVARNTVFAYKTREATPSQLANELGATAVVTGRVQRIGSSIVVGADLVRTNDGTQLWGERFQRPFSDILEVQEQIATSISEQLKIRLTTSERRRLVQRATRRSEAYERYLKARFHLNRRTADGLAQAVALFEQAVEADPKYALAWAGLAEVHALRRLRSTDGADATTALVEEAARKAIDLDPRLGDPHAALGLVAAHHRWDWTDAERSFRTAIALDPDLAIAHHWYARLLVLMGRIDEALLEARAAINLEPLSLVLNISYAGKLWMTGRNDEARRLCAKVLELEPRFYFAHWILSLVAFSERRSEEALATLHRTIETFGRQPELLGTLGYIEGRLGNRDTALALLREIDAATSGKDYIRLAEVCVGLGDHEAALQHAEQLFLNRGDVVVILSTPQYALLREDPRFAEMLKRIDFPDPRRRARAT